MRSPIYNRTFTFTRVCLCGRNQVKVFVSGLFELNQDMTAFKQHLRDFLVQLKEFAGADNSDLYLEERESELEQKRKADLEAAMRVPGMLKPSDRPDEMED
jgi:exportin-1